MRDLVTEYIDLIAMAIEVIGVIIILLGLTLALIKFCLAIKSQKTKSYRHLRQEIGRSMLLGLEVLVAGDIVATVATEPQMDQVLTLGLIVLIRTFLSLSLEIEVEGTFPWIRRRLIEEKHAPNHSSGTS